MDVLPVVIALTMTVQAGEAWGVQFPRGTATFFDTQATSAVPAADGVWVAVESGIARYTADGQQVAHPTPGGRPIGLAVAGDGSLWFATSTLVARMSTTGAIVEQHAIAGARALAVATDGALWYTRGSLGTIIGRIDGGAVTELPSPSEAWSIAPAPNGDVWILETGFGTAPDDLYRMAATGAVTVRPLSHDVLFGELQVLSDGTLFVGTGTRDTVLRLDPGAENFVVIDLPDSSHYLADPEGNLWVGGHGSLRFIGRSGSPDFVVDMPRDPRDCTNTPVYAYRPLAIDDSGGLWLRIFDNAAYLPIPLPCAEPDPPPLPDLIRVDMAQLQADHGSAHVPVSPAALAVLAAGLALAAAMQVRRAG